MVARTSHHMEWAQSPLKEARHDHRDRCLNHRLGSIMSGNNDMGTLVPRGETKAYKLFGVASSEVLCQGQGKHPDPSQDGQHYSPHLYKQAGRDSFTGAEPPDQRSVDMVPEQEYQPAGNASSREKKHHNGRVMKDRSDWMLCPRVFNKINQVMGPLQVDLFTSRLTHQLRDFVSWRSDPEAMATDAFTLDWKQFQGYANPPWSLVGRVLSQVREQKAQLLYGSLRYGTQPSWGW